MNNGFKEKHSITCDKWPLHMLCHTQGSCYAPKHQLDSHIGPRTPFTIDDLHHVWVQWLQKRPLKSKERKSPVNSCKQGHLFTTDINVHLWWSIWDGLLFTHGIYMFKKSLCTKYMMLSHGFLTRSEYGLSTLIAQHLDSFHLVSSTFSNVHNDY